jgi:hypothetical protein
VDWIRLAQDRDQWRAIKNTVEPSGFIKGGECLDHFNFLTRALLQGICYVETDRGTVNQI